MSVPNTPCGKRPDNFHNTVTFHLKKKDAIIWNISMTFSKITQNIFPPSLHVPRTFWTRETPGDVDVRMVRLSPDWLEVSTAHNIVALQLHTASRYTEFTHMVRRGAPYTLEETTCRKDESLAAFCVALIFRRQARKKNSGTPKKSIKDQTEPVRTSVCNVFPDRQKSYLWSTWDFSDYLSHMYHTRVENSKCCSLFVRAGSRICSLRGRTCRSAPLCIVSLLPLGCYKRSIHVHLKTWSVTSSVRNKMSFLLCALVSAMKPTCFTGFALPRSGRSPGQTETSGMKAALTNTVTLYQVPRLFTFWTDVFPRPGACENKLSG